MLEADLLVKINRMFCRSIPTTGAESSNPGLRDCDNAVLTLEGQITMDSLHTTFHSVFQAG